MKKLIILAAVLFSIGVQAQTPEQKGFDIAARSDRSDRGFESSEVEMTMVLRNAAGTEIRRTLLTNTLEVPDESLGDKSLILFHTPVDVEGTALLSHAQILKPDNQWLFLPALKRTKRISSANKSGPFVGSEFAFEDFTAQELNKFTYKFLREEPCPQDASLTCDVVERYPAYKKSGYKKQVAWTDQKDYQVRQVEFYDRRGDKLKTLSLEDYREYPGNVWRTHKMVMVNHKTGKSTDLLYSDYKFKTGLADKDFKKGVLSSLR
ncbi:outer membrane lipoprotein-sorting protein [Porticoccus sp. W117]|uniref:outer membrane lipoprotein-sorting protein n=1 Tax=Porticoccus sp. W117 TaxID=3054777 RepID=UPI002593D2FA|nr:outer membrane lipoprotein-sorting protein [Porticoccus sp. W117]MDM3870836.1 outer membrane lipoprotein-sorting protein [Porticoccus sp. W117]